MASLRRRGAFFYIRFRDECGKQTERRASRDKAVSRNMMRALEDKLTRIKLHLSDPRELDAAESDRRPISEHIEEYLKSLESRNCCSEHIHGTKAHLDMLVKETGVTRLSQMRPSLLDAPVSRLRAAGKSDQTIRHHVSCWKSFSRWAWKDRRTMTDLLCDMERPRVISSHHREALTPEQAALLVTTTRAQGKVRRGMSSEDRSWLYVLAMTTGFRRGELQSLSPESFDLDAVPPVVSLPGRDTKNSNDAIQPLPDHLIPDLRSWLASKAPDTFLFWKDKNTAPLIRADLKAAGIAPAAFDFHCLRHTFVSQIVAGGGSVKDSMTLARHSDASLTMGRYAHSQLSDLAVVVNRLPDLSPSHSLPTNGVSGGLNGNTGVSLTTSPERSHMDPSGHIHQPLRLNSDQKW